MNVSANGGLQSIFTSFTQQVLAIFSHITLNLVDCFKNFRAWAKFQKYYTKFGYMVFLEEKIKFLNFVLKSIFQHNKKVKNPTFCFHIVKIKEDSQKIVHIVYKYHGLLEIHALYGLLILMSPTISFV